MMDQQERRWWLVGSDFGGGGVHGYVDLGDWVASEENQVEHGDGEYKRITERGSGQPEVERSGGEMKVTGDGEESG